MAVTFKGEPQDVPLSKIRANPFRDFAINPLKTSKVEALRTDIDKIGFWSHSLQARPTESGTFELAFGHHRFEALKQLGAKTVPLSVSDLSDAEMLQFMAQENDEEWGGDPEQTREAVRAVVLAYGSGRLRAFPRVADRTTRGLRIAPSFQVIAYSDIGGGDEFPPFVYTADSIGEFLGWTEAAGEPSGRVRAAKRVNQALDALAIMEGREDQIGPRLSGLSKTQSAEVVIVARKAGEAAAKAVEARIPEAKKAGDDDRVAKLKETADRKRRDAEQTVIEKTVKQIKANGKVKDVSARQVREVAERVSPTKKQAMPDLNDFIRRTIGILDGVLAPGAEVWQRRGKFESFFLDAKIPMQDSWINGLRRNAKRLQRLLEDEADRFEKLQKKGTV